MKRKKFDRNDKCFCGSNKKYKFCCVNVELSDKYQENNLNSSNFIQKYINYLKSEFSNYKIIDISQGLELNNYKNYQLNNFQTKTIMIAERNQKNDDLFLEKGSLNGNIIIMNHGAYICFESQEFQKTKVTIIKMINGDLGKQCLICFQDSENNCRCSTCGNYFCFKCSEKLVCFGDSFIKCPFCKAEISGIHSGVLTNN